jgi:hypothetical protein
VITFTLADPYLKILSVWAHYAAVDASEDLYAQIDPASLLATIGTGDPVVMDVRLKTGANNTDPGASGGIIMVMLVAEDSGAY